MLTGSVNARREPRVVGDGPRPRVVLFGLPPVYESGLAAVLTSHGMVCSVLPRLAVLPGLLSQGPLVLVLPGARRAEVPVQLSGPAAGLSLVHVVDELSAAACADALCAGAAGVVGTTSDPATVATAVRSAAAGQTALPSSVARSLALGTREVAVELSGDERRWLRELADGSTVSALARSAGYSERETYRVLSAIYAKLGATNRIQALLIAERAGLLGDPP